MEKIVISKALLSEQYETMKVSEVADYYGICAVRLYKIIDEAGIPRKRNNKQRRAYKKTELTE
jgi:hypothetical protein